MAHPTILVIDDDQDFLEATETLLSAAGYQVRTASSTSAALEAVERETPDLVLVDLMMERADSGFSLAHKVRHTPGLVDVPIIMISGVTEGMGYRYSLDSPDERAWIKADMFLEKPLRSEDLLGHIRQMLDRPHEHRRE